MADAKKMIKPPKLKKLSPEMKSDKPMKEYKYDPRPTFCVDQADLPEMESWKVGEEYTLTVKVKMEEYRSSMDHDSGKEKTRGDFRIVSIGAAK